VVEAARATATARHFFEVCVAYQAAAALEGLCRRAAAACRHHVGGALDVEILMIDFEGQRVVARG
jgi:cobalt-precorrin-5B (C1)-methyltransferase